MFKSSVLVSRGVVVVKISGNVGWIFTFHVFGSHHLFTSARLVRHFRFSDIRIYDVLRQYLLYDLFRCLN